jgi:hypothetical protein
MANWFITAAGHASRVNGKVKQLFPINGEPIYHRTIRLIKAVDPNPLIYVITWRKELTHPDVVYIDTKEPTKCLYDTILRTLPYWGVRNCVLMGDTVFTEDAIRTIYNNSHRKMCYGRYRDIKHGNPERYALTFSTDYDLKDLRNRMKFCVDHTLRNDVPCCMTDTLWMPLLKVAHVLSKCIRTKKGDIINQIYIRTPLITYMARCTPMIILEDEVRDIDTPEEWEDVINTWEYKSG